MSEEWRAELEQTVLVWAVFSDLLERKLLLCALSGKVL